MSLSILHRRRLIQGTLVNTYIGGVSSTITTKGELATKLGITESDIGYFEVVGSDIEAAININYDIPTDAFNSDTSITKFLDNAGRVQNLGYMSFRYASNLSEINFPKATYIDGYCFQNCAFSSADFPLVSSIWGDSVFRGNTILSTVNMPELLSITDRGYTFDGCGSLNDIYMPKCTQIHTTGYDYVFRNTATGGQITIDESMATINNGGEEGDIAHLRSNGWTITYV